MWRGCFPCELDVREPYYLQSLEEQVGRYVEKAQAVAVISTTRKGGAVRAARVSTWFCRCAKSAVRKATGFGVAGVLQ